MKIRVYDIHWFYNYEDHSDYITKEEYDKTFYAEPTEIIYDLDDDNWIEDCENDEEIEDCISNVISDDSGYYHEGFSWEIIK